MFGKDETAEVYMNNLTAWNKATVKFWNDDPPGYQKALVADPVKELTALGATIPEGTTVVIAVDTATQITLPLPSPANVNQNPIGMGSYGL